MASSYQEGAVWWKADVGQVHERIAGFLKQYASSEDAMRVDELARYARLYANYVALGASSAPAYLHPSPLTINRVTFNVVQSITDFIHARIAKNRPKPTPATIGGSYSMQKKAKLLDLFLQGIFYEQRTYEQGALAALHSKVFGTSAVKILVENAKIRVERLFVDELVVDGAECAFGKPRQMHQRRPLPKDLVLEAYPQFVDQIKAAKEAPDTGFAARRADLIWVTESWHLKSGPKAKDGRHAITIDGCDLLVEDYDEEDFPFVFLRWKEPLRGFWGQGIPEQLMGIQAAINQILMTIQECLTWAVPKAIVRRGAKIVKSHLNGDPGGIIEVENPDDVHVTTWNSVPEVLFAQLDRLYAKAFDIIGASQDAAESEKPAGVTSGAGIREVDDIQSIRFVMFGKAYEQFYLDIAVKVIDQARKLYRSKKVDTKVNVLNRRVVDEIKWSDIDLDRDSFQLQMFPTSSLPATLGGKLQRIDDMQQLGILTNPADILRLLDLPDLEEFNALAEADAMLCHKQIEDILEGGAPEKPEPFQNLDYALKTAQATYLRVRTMEDVPEARLEALRMFIVEVARLQQPAAGTPAPMPGAPTGPAGGPMLPGAPGGAPMPGGAPGQPMPPGAPAPMH